MANILDPRDLVAVQIQDVKLGKVLEISNLFDLVLAEHEHS
jgi:hypothetical protein